MNQSLVWHEESCLQFAGEGVVYGYG